MLSCSRYLPWLMIATLAIWPAAPGFAQNTPAADVAEQPENALPPADSDEPQPTTVTAAEQFDQVVWDWHAYGGVSRSGKVSDVYRDMTYGEMSGIYDTILANLAANDLPVLVGEFGHDWNDGRRTDGGWSYVSMVNSARLNVERLTDAGIGMTVWHANGSSGIRMEYGLKASDDLTFDEPTVDSNLSTLGQLYWDLTRTLGG